ncbi:MAG: 8-amino-7-oxononanoate synthase [Gammaproteobacteria bacterium]|nr:MAG: 8-amino-7-oxononanoate synthase [Gammaproteobacteria bacterium]RLA53265.1 MAG: 8-amino-7-oxononanoate synthase [Gammaproteobacteria bacterium]
MVSPDRELLAALNTRRENSLYRYRKTLQSAQGPRVKVDGRACIGFSSNDYLGLANHPALISAFNEAANKYGVGSGASHLVSGHSCLHQALEEDLAEFTGRPRALLFSTGYMANMGIIRALTDVGDLVVQDRLNHASLLDGGFLSRAEFQRYPHRDLPALENTLATVSGKRKLLVTDGVFSMDGDLGELPALAAIADCYNSWLMVDDAHGFGVLGENGRGVAEHFDMSIEQLPILVGTLGKAFGTFGAFVAGSEALIETLIQFGRTYIYTTALPPAVAAATQVALQLVDGESWRRQKLHSLITRFQQGARHLDIPVLESITPIQPVVIGDDQKVMRISESLLDAGFWVGAIRPPTVPEGSARLRITLNAGHDETDVDTLLEALCMALRDYG